MDKLGGEKMVDRKKRGQSMLEYVLLVTVIILVVIYAANNVLKPRVTRQVDEAGNLMTNAINSFTTVTQAQQAPQ